MNPEEINAIVENGKRLQINLTRMDESTTKTGSTASGKGGIATATTKSKSAKKHKSSEMEIERYGLLASTPHKRPKLARVEEIVDEIFLDAEDEDGGRDEISAIEAARDLDNNNNIDNAFSSEIGHALQEEIKAATLGVNFTNPWLACILWDSKILQKMKDNIQSGYDFYTARAMAKMLLKPLKAWPEDLNLTTPHILVEILPSQKMSPPKSNGFLFIQVIEKTWAKNMDIPPSQRVWNLVIPNEMSAVVNEMLRNPSITTTVLIWNHQQIPYERPHPLPGNGLLSGVILLNLEQETTPALLIFHHEVPSIQRRQHILSHFKTCELKGLHQPGTLKRYIEVGGKDEESKLAVAVTPCLKEVVLVHDLDVGKQINWNEQEAEDPNARGVKVFKEPYGKVVASIISRSENQPQQLQDQPPPAIPGPSSRLLPMPKPTKTITESRPRAPSHIRSLNQSCSQNVQNQNGDGFISMNESQQIFMGTQRLSMDIELDSILEPPPLCQTGSNPHVGGPVNDGKAASSSVQNNPSGTQTLSDDYQFSQFINQLK